MKPEIEAALKRCEMDLVGVSFKDGMNNFLHLIRLVLKEIDERIEKGA